MYSVLQSLNCICYSTKRLSLLKHLLHWSSAPSLFILYTVTINTLLGTCCFIAFYQKESLFIGVAFYAVLTLMQIFGIFYFVVYVIPYAFKKNATNYIAHVDAVQNDVSKKIVEIKVILNRYKQALEAERRQNGKT